MNVPFVSTTVITLCLSSAFAQNDIITSLDFPLSSNNEEFVKESEEIFWVEDESARTLYTSTYYSETGAIKIRNSSRAINYYTQDGKLRAINPQLRPTPNGYSAPDQPYPTYLYSDGSMGISLNSYNNFIFGQSTTFNSSSLSTELQFEGNGGTLQSENLGVKKVLAFRENGVKYDYHLSNLVKNSGHLIFAEIVSLPHGYRMVKDLDHGEETAHGWAGLLNIVSPEGLVEGTFHEVVCFDQLRDIHIASYEFHQVGNQVSLKIIIEEDWVNANERSFPLIIDPIVTGPTSTWAGGYINSCIIPAYEQDSILVTVPADITITELNVTSSFYADPFTAALMQDGSMYFSTDCDQSQTFTITGVPGQSAGTAYLENFNLYNPLTCCLSELCSSQTFWLSYHLGRTMYGAGCNSTYIRHDPFTTSWPFEATVVGRTPEPAASEWNVSNAPICANQCELSGLAYVFYGVPPYTFTHPWSTDTIVAGSSPGCNSGYIAQNIDMIIPSCPDYCDTINTTLSVPPPIIWDACGNFVAPAQAESVTLKPAPGLIPVYPPIICSGEELLIDLGQCLPEAITQWSGNNASGWNDTIIHTIYTSQDSVVLNYTATTEWDGCISDTFDVSVTVYPNPNTAYTTDPDPIISGVPVNFNDATVFNGSPGVYWAYLFGDGTTSPNANSSHIYPDPGDYWICLTTMNDVGCVDSICHLVPVAPAEVQIPNVVTVNGDMTNDILEFQYLDFYPNNHLTVMNRWGSVLLDQDNYANDWIPSEHPEGVYFFRLTLTDTGREYSGFFHLIRE